MSLFNPPINEDFDGVLIGQPGRTFRRVFDADVQPPLGCAGCCFNGNEDAFTDECARVTCHPVTEIWTHYEEIK